MIPNKDAASPSLGIDCERLEPEEVEDLRQFLLSSDSNLKIEKPFRVKTHDSAESLGFLTGHHDLVLFGLGAVGKSALDIGTHLIESWLDSRNKSRECEVVTLYGPSDEAVKTVKIFKKQGR